MLSMGIYLRVEYMLSILYLRVEYMLSILYLRVEYMLSILYLRVEYMLSIPLRVFILKGWIYAQYIILKGWIYAQYIILKGWIYAQYIILKGWIYAQYIILKGWIYAQYIILKGWIYAQYIILKGWIYAQYIILKGWIYASLIASIHINTGQKHDSLARTVAFVYKLHHSGPWRPQWSKPDGYLPRDIKICSTVLGLQSECWAPGRSLPTVRDILLYSNASLYSFDIYSNVSLYSFDIYSTVSLYSSDNWYVVWSYHCPGNRLPCHAVVMISFTAKYSCCVLFKYTLRFMATAGKFLLHEVKEIFYGNLLVIVYFKNASVFSSLWGSPSVALVPFGFCSSAARISLFVRIFILHCWWENSGCCMEAMDWQNSCLHRIWPTISLFLACCQEYLLKFYGSDLNNIRFVPLPTTHGWSATEEAILLEVRTFLRGRKYMLASACAGPDSCLMNLATRFGLQSIWGDSLGVTYPQGTVQILSWPYWTGWCLNIPFLQELLVTILIQPACRWWHSC